MNTQQVYTKVKYGIKYHLTNIKVQYEASITETALCYKSSALSMCRNTNFTFRENESHKHIISNNRTHPNRLSKMNEHTTRSHIIKA